MLDWVIRRLEGDAESIETPIGNLPADGSMKLDGLGLTDEQTAELFAVEPKNWLDEAELTEQYFSQVRGARSGRAERSADRPA